MPVLGNPGDSLEAAQRCADLGVGALVTLGGDGTVNEVVNGLLTDGPSPRLPMLAAVHTSFAMTSARLARLGDGLTFGTLSGVGARRVNDAAEAAAGLTAAGAANDERDGHGVRLAR